MDVCPMLKKKYYYYLFISKKSVNFASQRYIMLVKNQSKEYLSGVDKHQFRIDDPNAQSLNRKQLMWQARIYSELKRAGYRWFFITLTYDDDHLPCTPFSFGDIDFNVSHFNRRHITLFIKRLRDYIGVGVRYYICSEYGGQKGRPHYHALLGIPATYFLDHDVPLLLSTFQRCWYDEDTHDPLGYILPNPDTTADDETRDIYYLPHSFIDKHGIKRIYQGVEVECDKLPQMSAYVAKYVLKDSSFIERPEIDILKKYSIDKRKYQQLYNSIQFLSSIDSDHYQFLCDELLFRLDLSRWLNEVGCFHRCSLGFGLQICDQFGHFDDNGRFHFAVPLGEDLRKKIHEGYNVGCKRNGNPLQCPIPDYIRQKMFYKLERYEDNLQWHNEQKEDYYGKIKYKRVKTCEYCTHLDMLTIPSIYEKQSLFFRNLQRWTTCGNDSINEMLSFGLPDIETRTLLDVSLQLSIYAHFYRDVDATFPVNTWQQVLDNIGILAKNQHWHNVEDCCPNSAFDVPIVFDLPRNFKVLQPDISQYVDDVTTPLYNTQPIFAPLENLLDYIESRMKEESYQRYMSFLQRHNEVQDYANKTIRPQH